MTTYTAYYLNGSLFSIVPAHVRDDFAWMADHGTAAVAISAYERDLSRQRTWDLFAAEADRAGLKLYVVPSRWAGLVAGWPGAPSRFCCTHPEALVLNEEGGPRVDGPWALMASVHHPETEAFYRHCLDTILRYPVAGLIWDEVKTLHAVDHNPLAKQALGPDAPLERHTDAVAGFFDRVTAYAKVKRPGLTATMFLYGALEGYALDRCARIASLDYFGCDGRPFTAEDSDVIFGPGNRPNLLLPHAERFLAAARGNGKGGFVLIENMGLPATAIDIIDRRLPEVLALRPEHVAYYYFGADCDDPERLMAVIGKHCCPP